MKSLTFSVVFFEGIATFISPCFLPLIPIYIGYLSGEATGRERRRSVIINSIFFIIGFTLVFTCLGAAASSLGRFLRVHKGEINKVLGVLVVIMGLFYTGILRINFLNMSKKFEYKGEKSGIFSSFVLGIALAFGWTPCFGPILTNVLAIAASKASITYGILLLFIYSMGIAVPFLITGVFIEGLSRKLRAVLKYNKVIMFVTGILLIITGILIYTGYLGVISQELGII